MARLLLAAWLVQATFSAKTELVVVPVFVTDEKGNVVAGLPREAFRIYDEGRQQPVQTFHHGEVASTIGLLVDNSQSMRPNLPLVVAGVSAFVNARRSDDEMFLFPFNEQVTAGLFDGKPFGNGRQLTEPLLSSLPAGGTALYDAVVEGLARVAQGTSDRRALVVVSDGGDNASRRSYDQVIAAVRRASVVVYAVGLPAPDRDKRAVSLLTRLCAETGGTAKFISSPAAAESVLVDIARDLRQQYTLGFVPQDSRRGAATRRIKVVVSSPGKSLRVRTRASYLGS